MGAVVVAILELHSAVDRQQIIQSVFCQRAEICSIPQGLAQKTNDAKDIFLIHLATK